MARFLQMTFSCSPKPTVRYNPQKLSDSGSTVGELLLLTNTPKSRPTQGTLSSAFRSPHSATCTASPLRTSPTSCGHENTTGHAAKAYATTSLPGISKTTPLHATPSSHAIAPKAPYGSPTQTAPAAPWGSHNNSRDRRRRPRHAHRPPAAEKDSDRRGATATPTAPLPTPTTKREGSAQQTANDRPVHDTLEEVAYKPRFEPTHTRPTLAGGRFHANTRPTLHHSTQGSCIPSE